MITIKDIARECDVSIATVSNIFNGKGRVSEQKKQQILEKAKEMGYVPNIIARNLKEKSTKTIGIITEDFTVFNNAEIVDGIHEQLEEAGYHFLLGNLRLYKKYGSASSYREEIFREQVEDEFLMMKSKQVDGVIYIASHCRKINCIPENYGLPIILAYSYTERPGQISVMYDDEQAAFDAIELLIRKGHRKIGIIAGEEGSFHTKWRREGVKRCLKENGIPWKDSYEIIGNWERKKGYEACKMLMEKGISAFFAMNDVMAAGVYDYATETGKEIGKDISLVGFDNREFSTAFHPELTTIDIPLHEIGKKAAFEMLTCLKAERMVETSQKELIYKMPCCLVERESVKINLQ